MELRVYNEARETTIEVYHEIKKRLLNIKDDGKEEEPIDFSNLDIIQMLEDDEELLFSDGKEKDRAQFIVKLNTIHDEWRKKKSRVLA